MNSQKQLKRLIVAVSTFEAVADACKFLIERDVGENSPYFRIFTAGIAVSYMRPFVQADGLGPLPEYEKFPSDPEHAKLHKDLKKGRHLVFAHHSATNSPSLVSPEKQEDVKNIVLNFDDNGNPEGYVVNSIHWNRDRLHAIISLCQFQAQRIMDDVMPLMKHMGKAKTYRGKHILGKTFP